MRRYAELNQIADRQTAFFEIEKQGTPRLRYVRVSA